MDLMHVMGGLHSDMHLFSYFPYISNVLHYIFGPRSCTHTSHEPGAILGLWPPVLQTEVKLC